MNGFIIFGIMFMTATVLENVANLQELYYTRLVRKMASYKILIQVLCSSSELRCVSLIGDAQTMLN